MGYLRNPFRPEKHYMRGPGPKWHAKHTASLIAAASAQPTADTNMRRAGADVAQLGIAGWIASTVVAAMLGFMAVMALA